jgi:hypothetical protein
MSNVSSSRQAGRFQSRHRVVDPTLRNLATLATGGFFIHPVVQGKIRITNIGFTADSDTGAVTTIPVLAIERLTAADNNVWSEWATTAKRLPAVLATQQGPTDTFMNMDKAGLSPAGLKLKEDFPMAVRGDLLRFNLITQGAGGVQTGYVWYEFCEEPDPEVSTTA